MEVTILPRRQTAKEKFNTEQSRQRVVIEGVKPETDGGRFPVKRTIGDRAGQ
jgi:hypothetical protein